uniref:Uncharacterized protein n=1 Tax=Sipha flava TaxID=143950 RepID=A0A2S2Q0N2_9HEMI
MSVSYTLLTVVVAAVAAALFDIVAAVLFVVAASTSDCRFSASAADDFTATASWVSEPDMGAAALMDRPIFSNRLPSLPVFFSCSKSGVGCERCSCCRRMYCSCSAFCFFNSSWCRCSSCSCLLTDPVATKVACCCCCCAIGGSGIGGLPQPPLEGIVDGTADMTVVSDPLRLGGLPADDDTELLGDVDATEPPTHVVGDATGDLELVRGGGGGGMRLFCRSGVRSGTGGLPASDEVLLNRRSTGFGARHAGATGVTAVTAAVSATVTNAVAAVSVAAVTADDVDGGVVWSSSSKVSSAFSVPVGSRFPAPPSDPVPAWSTTLPCPTTLPCGTDKKTLLKRVPRIRHDNAVFVHAS